MRTVSHSRRRRGDGGDASGSEQQLKPVADGRYFVDTLHLSSAGAEAVATALVPHIQAVLSEKREVR